jgi:hypothetical protein
MPRESPRLATIGRHNINVEVPGILAAESDPSTVRREMRI